MRQQQATGTLDSVPKIRLGNWRFSFRTRVLLNHLPHFLSCRKVIFSVWITHTALYYAIFLLVFREKVIFCLLHPRHPSMLSAVFKSFSIWMNKCNIILTIFNAITILSSVDEMWQWGRDNPELVLLWCRWSNHFSMLQKHNAVVTPGHNTDDQAIEQCDEQCPAEAGCT